MMRKKEEKKYRDILDRRQGVAWFV